MIINKISNSKFYTNQDVKAGTEEQQQILKDIKSVDMLYTVHTMIAKMFLDQRII